MWRQMSQQLQQIHTRASFACAASHISVFYPRVCRRARPLRGLYRLALRGSWARNAQPSTRCMRNKETAERARRVFSGPCLRKHLCLAASMLSQWLIHLRRGLEILNIENLPNTLSHLAHSFYLSAPNLVIFSKLQITLQTVTTPLCGNKYFVMSCRECLALKLLLTGLKVRLSQSKCRLKSQNNELQEAWSCVDLWCLAAFRIWFNITHILWFFEG